MYVNCHRLFYALLENKTKQKDHRSKIIAECMLSSISYFFSESDKNLNQIYSKSNWEDQAINSFRQGLIEAT